MKLNNNGWGYRVFVMCLSALSTFLLIAHHYINVLMGVLAK